MCQISTLLYEYPKKHDLSVEWIADTIGVNSSTLHRYLNPHDPRQFPLSLLIPFCKACNEDYSAINLLEERIGRIAHTAPSPEKKITTKDIVKTIKTLSESITKMSGVIEDGIIDEDEKALLKNDFFWLSNKISILQAKLHTE